MSAVALSGGRIHNTWVIEHRQVAKIITCEVLNVKKHNVDGTMNEYMLCVSDR
jgi:hypothetical protein